MVIDASTTQYIGDAVNILSWLSVFVFSGTIAFGIGYWIYCTITK